MEQVYRVAYVYTDMCGGYSQVMGTKDIMFDGQFA